MSSGTALAMEIHGIYRRRCADKFMKVLSTCFGLEKSQYELLEISTTDTEATSGFQLRLQTPGKRSEIYDYLIEAVRHTHVPDVYLTKCDLAEEVLPHPAFNAELTITAQGTTIPNQLVAHMRLFSVLDYLEVLLLTG